MVDGTITNNGFILIADTELNDGFTYKTSDNTTASQRPKLVIGYTVPGGTATATPSLPQRKMDLPYSFRITA
jgi:hypothetical protein